MGQADSNSKTVAEPNKRRTIPAETLYESSNSNSAIPGIDAITVVGDLYNSGHP